MEVKSKKEKVRTNNEERSTSVCFWFVVTLPFTFPFDLAVRYCEGVMTEERKEEKEGGQKEEGVRCVSDSSYFYLLPLTFDLS